MIDQFESILMELFVDCEPLISEEYFVCNKMFTLIFFSLAIQLPPAHYWRKPDVVC